MATPSWAEVLGDDYGHFRAALVEVLQQLQIVIDEAHLDCGVLHTPGGSLGLSNVARLCRAAPLARWPDVIHEHLQRATAKPAETPLESAMSMLRVRFVPEHQVQHGGDRYVARPFAPGLQLTLALDKPEHVVFVNRSDLAAWGRSADELFAIAVGNTEAEPALEREEIEIPDGVPIIALAGESYFAASQVLVLERYLPAHPDGHLIALPDRHNVLALPLTDARCLRGFGPMVQLAHAGYSEEPGALTDQLYWRRGDQYLRVACGVRADGQSWSAPPEELIELVARLA